jgi:hypothetical protein
VPVAAGKPYIFSGWVAVPPYTSGAALTLKPEIVWEDGAGNPVRTDVATGYTKPFGGWDEFMTTKQPPAGATQAAVTFSFANLRATAYLDDVSFGPAY